jgi:hypothetical protein
LSQPSGRQRFDILTPFDSNNVFVVGTDNRLWLEFGPFGQQIPPQRVPVDDNVDVVQPVSAEDVFVLDWDGNLWREHAPFGAIPLPPALKPLASARVSAAAT